MPDIGRQHGVSERKRCSANQQVWERDHDAFGRLLTVDPPCKQRGLVGVGIYRQAGTKLFYKLLTAKASLRCVCLSAR
jgi:hypothetical protein